MYHNSDFSVLTVILNTFFQHIQLFNKLLVDVSIVIHRNIYKITYFSNEFLSWGTKNKGQHYPTVEAQWLHVLTESKHW